jgi:disulfide bond formation protein DsbB
MSYLLPGLAMPGVIFPLLAPAKYSPFIPLVGWTFALQWFIDEYYSFSSWTMMPRGPTDGTPDRNQTANHEQRDELLGKWFQNWFHRGGLCAAFFTPLTVFGSIVGIYRSYTTSTEPLTPASPIVWTSLGLALTLYHIRFGGSQYNPFKRIGTAGNEGNNVQDLTGWVAMHKKRILFIDVPTWICFAIAAALSV